MISEPLITPGRKTFVGKVGNLDVQYIDAFAGGMMGRPCLKLADEKTIT